MERPKSVQRLDLAVRIVVATATLLTAVLMVWFIRRDMSARASTLERSLLVLPVESSLADTSDRLFVDGFADELRVQLGASGLRVTGRDAALAFKAPHPTAMEIGKMANVATILSTQLRKRDDQFHLTATLSNTANDAVLLTFDRDSRISNMVMVQRELVDSIISRFGIAPVGASRP